MDLKYHFSFLFSEGAHTVLSCVFALAALIVAFRTQDGRREPDWRWIWVIAGLLLIGRWPAIWYPHQLNPDESQLLASVHTLRFDPVFWRSVNGMTSGPLNSYALWPMGWLLGSDSYLAARLTAVLFNTVALAAVHLTVSRRYGAKVARMSGLPTLCLLSLSGHPDFNHYSTELLSIACIAVAFYLATRMVFDGEHAGWREMVIGLLLGCVPLAKLQATPMAFFLGVAVAAWLWFSPVAPRENRGVRLLRLVGSAFVPLFILTIMVVLNGLGSYVWITYWLNNRAYVENGQMSVVQVALKLMLWVDPRSSILFFWIFSGLMFFGLALPWLKTRDRQERLFVGMSLALLVIAALSVLTPRRPFAHYMMLLPVPWTLACGGVMHVLMRRREEEGLRGPALGAWTALSTTVVILTLMRAGMSYPLGVKFSPFNSDYSGRVTLEVRKFAGPRDALVVWGWRCEYYVLTGLRQGTRDALTETLMVPGEYNDFFRRIYLSDIKRSQPAVFVDGVGPGAFYYDERAKQGHEVFPELSEWIAKNYRLASDIDGARIYVREDRFREVTQRENVPPTGERFGRN